MWVYIRTEPGLWTVGFYGPGGHWHTDSDHNSTEAAAERVRWLNGGAQFCARCEEVEVERDGDYCGPCVRATLGGQDE